MSAATAAAHRTAPHSGIPYQFLGAQSAVQLYTRPDALLDSRAAGIKPGGASLLSAIELLPLSSSSEMLGAATVEGSPRLSKAAHNVRKWVFPLLAPLALGIIGWQADKLYDALAEGIQDGQRVAAAAQASSSAVGLDLSRTREEFTAGIGRLQTEFAGLRGDVNARAAEVNGELKAMNVKLGAIDSTAQQAVQELRMLPKVQPRR